MPSHRSGSGREPFPKVREWSGGPPGGPRVVGRPSQRFGRPSWRSGNGQEALPVVREWSGAPLGGPGVVGRPSRRSRSGREALP